MISKIILSFFAMVYCLALIASPNVTKLSSIATSKNFPNADSCLLYNFLGISYEADGSYVKVDDFYQKVLTESGRKELREITMRFNENYNKYLVKIVEVIKPNGQIVKVDLKGNLKIAIDSSQMSSNIFDPAEKVLSFSIPNLAIGDIVHIKSVENGFKSRIPNQWSDIVVLQYNIPILQYDVEVNGPKSLPLKSIAIKDKEKNTLKSFPVEKKGSRLLYKWQAKNVPEIIPEPNMPPFYLCAQRLLLSTAQNWQEISRWYYNLCRPRIDRKTYQMEKKVKELLKGAKDDNDKIMRLFQFVSQQIRYTGITEEKTAPGYEPRNVDETFNRRYGVCRDKAALLVALLEIANFKAYPVLFMAGKQVKDKEVPNIYFNHAIACVETSPGKYILMDPTYETTRELLPSTLSNQSYLVAHPKGDILRRSPQIKASINNLKITSNSQLLSNGSLNGKLILEFFGVNDLIYRDFFSNYEKSLLEQYFSTNLKNSFPGAKLEDFIIYPKDIRDMSKPLKVTIKFSANNLLPQSNLPQVFTIPEFSSRFGFIHMILRELSLEQRKFNYMTSSTCAVTEESTLTLPPQLKVTSLPEKLKTSIVNVARLERDITAKNNTLTLKSLTSLDNVEITPTAYKKLRELTKEIKQSTSLRPIVQLDYSKLSFAELKAALPDKEHLNLKNYINITCKDNSSYTVELEKSKIVLNYAGMKSAGEITIPFNPIYEKIELTGLVTSPAGKKYKLLPKDIKIMDQSWVSSAPRYPAGKQLVATFPNVQIGSIVSFNIKSTFKDMPFFSYVCPITSSNPIVDFKFTLQAPKKMALKKNSLPSYLQVHEEYKGDTFYYTVKGQNIPAKISESSQLPLVLDDNVIILSSGNWKEFATKLDSALRKKVDGKSIEIAKIAQELKLTTSNNKKSQLANVTKIRNFVSSVIREAGPSLQSLPWSCFSKAGQTLIEGYGNSTDRAILIASFLEYCNIPFDFTCVFNIAYTPQVKAIFNKYPQLEYDNLLVYIPQLNTYLNDTSEYAQLGSVFSEDCLGLNLTKKALIKINSNLNDKEKVNKVFNITLLPNNSCKINVVNNYYNLSYEQNKKRFALMIPMLRERYFLKMATNVSQSAKLIATPNYNFNSYPGVISFDIEVPKFASLQGKYTAFELPCFTNFLSFIKVSDNRQTTFWPADKVSLTYLWNITIPANQKVINILSKKVEIGSKDSAYFIREIETKDNLLQVKVKLELPIEKVTLDKYKILEQIQRKLADPAERNIILTWR